MKLNYTRILHADLILIALLLIPVLGFIFLGIISINMNTNSLLEKRAEYGKTEDHLRIIYLAILQWATQPHEKDTPIFPENLEELVRKRLIKREMLSDPISGLPIEYFPILSEEAFQENPPLLRSRVGTKYCIMYAKGNVIWEEIRSTR